MAGIIQVNTTSIEEKKRKGGEGDRAFMYIRVCIVFYFDFVSVLFVVKTGLAV